MLIRSKATEILWDRNKSLDLHVSYANLPNADRIVVVEVAGVQARWTEPIDPAVRVDPQALKKVAALVGSGDPHGLVAMFLDGEIRRLPAETVRELLLEQE